MKKEDLTKEYLNILNTFNHVVTTTRLYSVLSPQFRSSFSRAFSVIKRFIDVVGDVQFGFLADKQIVCGVLLGDDMLALSNKITVFKQLSLLNLPHLVLTKQLDEDSFREIISVFSARKEKIQREGGGRSFVTKLGLEQFFPEEYSYETKSAHSIDHLDKGRIEVNLRGLGELDDSVTAFIFDDSVGISLQFSEKKDDESWLIVFLFYCLSRAAFKMNLEKKFLFSPLMGEVLDKVGKYIDPSRAVRLAKTLAWMIVERGNQQAVASLLLSSFSSLLGNSFLRELIEAVDPEIFEKSYFCLKEHQRELLQKGLGDSREMSRCNDIEARLMASSVGSHLIKSMGLTKQILEDGEEQRRKKRLDRGVGSLIEGKLDVLKSEELLLLLPGAIDELIEAGNKERVDKLLGNICIPFDGYEEDIQRQRAMCLCLCGKELIRLKRWLWVGRIVPLLLDWLRKTEEGDSLLESVVEFLQTVTIRKIMARDEELPVLILDTFMRIRSGNIKKSSSVRALVSRAQDKIVNEEIIFSLLEEYLVNKDKNSAKLIILHGPAGASLLINKVVESDNSLDRMKIMELLNALGSLLPPVLLQALETSLPWYGVRNLLKLLSTTGSEEHADICLEYLCHADLRVQREAFLCLYKLGGNRRRELLLKALNLDCENIKVQIVKALGNYGDGEVAAGLLSVLRLHGSFGKNNREKLILQICHSLESCKLDGYKDELAKIYNELKDGKEPGQQKIESALVRLLERLGGVFRREKGSSIKSSDQTSEDKAERTLQPITSLPEESKIRALLKNGDEKKAKQLLIGLIITMARKRKFEYADNLRKWLIEIDPMMLSEIIRTAEIIEEEKSQAIDKGILEVWDDLYEVLSADEFSTLYHTMQHRKYDKDETVVVQGKVLSALFFIHQGKLKLHYNDHGSEVFVKNAGPGEVLGVDSFFNASVWTINATTMGRSYISMLRLEKLQDWKDDFPALESKLNDYCLKFDTLYSFFKKSKKNRREYDRKTITGKMSAIFLNEKNDEKGVNTRGELADISRGGVSFFIRISRKNHARMLLGRKIRVILPAIETVGKHIYADGMVVAIRAHLAMENEYSIHIRLEKLLSNDDIRKIIGAQKAANRNM